MLTRLTILLLGAGLTACSSYTYKAYNAERVGIVDSLPGNAEIDSMTAPYRRELSLEMNREIGTAAKDMQIVRPNSLMGQWVTDVLLQYGKDSLLKERSGSLPVIALWNTGGIRASLSKGTLTVGDIYKVMPFDNQVIALKLPMAQMGELVQYIRKSGGEPIAGMRIVNGNAVFTGTAEVPEAFWVITSDFLANGGDKMLFLQQYEEKVPTSIFMRDLLLREVERRKVIDPQPEERITF